MTKFPCPAKYRTIVDEVIRVHNGSGYHKIADWIKEKYGITIKKCWIADRKRALGYHVRRAPNAQW